MTPARAVLVARSSFVLATIAPWLMWLDLNLMAVRFVQLRGHWPMCSTTLPCHPDVWYVSDNVGSIWEDPVHQVLDPAHWQECLVMLSAPVWFVLLFVVGKRFSLAARWWLFATTVAGWLCLIFDPTFAVGWYLD